MLDWLVKSATERKIDKLCRTTQGAQALEDAIATWHRNTGRVPTDEDLDGIVFWVETTLSPVREWAGLVLLGLWLIVAIVTSVVSALRATNV